MRTLILAAGLVATLAACAPSDDERRAMYDSGYKAIEEKIMTGACLLRDGEAAADVRALIDRVYPADVAAKEPEGFVAYARNLYDRTAATTADAAQANACWAHTDAMSKRSVGDARRIRAKDQAYDGWLIDTVIEDSAKDAGCDITVSTVTDAIEARFNALPASGAGAPAQTLREWAQAQAIQACAPA